MSSSEKANLARIRDNQRRSRARRKEYLQELEARLRQCELQGIEASSEIQLAARRVADENKKLRGLLAQQGVGDESVEAFLQSSSGNESLGSNRYGSMSANVQILEHLLQARKVGSSDGSVSQPAMRNMGSRDSSVSAGTIHSSWDPNHNSQTFNGRGRPGALHSTGKAASSAQQFITSSSTGQANSPNRSHKRTNSILHPTQNQSGDLYYDPHLSNSSVYSSSPHQHIHSQNSAMSSPGYNPSTTVFSTNIITTMAGADPSYLKEYLIGRRDSKSTYVGNGKEIWESWKRAWDIWNGYYIEGRVNEVWVGGQLKKLEKEDRERRAREEAVEHDSFFDFNDPDDEKDMDLDEEVDGKENEEDEEKDQEDEEDKEDDEDRGTNTPAPIPAPAPAPTNNRPHGHRHHGDQGNRVLRSSGLKRKQSSADPSTRPSKKNSSIDFKPSLRGGAGNFYAYDSSSGDEANRYDFPSSRPKNRGSLQSTSTSDTLSASSAEIQYPTLPPFDPSLILYPKRPSSSGSSTGDIDAELEAPKSMKKGSIAPADRTNSQTSPRLRGSTTLRGSPVKPSGATTSSSGSGSPAKSGSKGNLPLPLPPYSSILRDHDTRETASAGWKLMKYLPDYKEPEIVTNEGPEWLDLVSNSVWRPRDVGEKKVKIHIDDEIEDFLQNTKLEVDGGVDCGRSPYPVLRPIYQYVKTKQGLFKKKKTWDKVTGTVFNMPTKPLEGEEDENDALSRIVKFMYSGFHKRDAKPDFFPLDIRRCEVVELPIDEAETKERKVESTDIVLKYPPNQKQIEHRPMRQDDPWWVTEEQRKARDEPPRHYPPKSSTEVSQLTLDDYDWEEEYSKDARYDARYFVTNLDGRTLLINGLEVRRGEIAGPLPAFAVIECPGGQVAFWWGQGGRSKGGRVGAVDDPRAWDALRRLRGWGLTGLLAGDVWNQKILHKIKKQFDDGEEEEADEWKRCREAYDYEVKARAAEIAEHSSGELEEPEGPSDRECTPEIFHTEDDELKFIVARFDEQEQRDAAEKEATRAKDPANNFWPGPVSKDQRIVRLTQEETEQKWDRKAVHTLQTQRKLAAAEATRKNQLRLQKITEQASTNKKRGAPTWNAPNIKRVKLAEERARKEIEYLIRREVSARENSRQLTKVLAAPKYGWDYYAAEGLRAAKLEYELELEGKRTAENLRRAKNGDLQPQIPPRPKDFMADADPATVEKFNTDHRAEIEELQKRRVEAANAKRVITQTTQAQAAERLEDAKKKQAQNLARRKLQLTKQLARLDNAKTTTGGLGSDDSEDLNAKRKEKERVRSQEQATLREDAKQVYKTQQLQDQKITEKDLKRKWLTKEATARKLAKAARAEEEMDRAFRDQHKREAEEKRLEELARKKHEEDEKNAKTRKTKERLEKERKEREAAAAKNAERERKEKEDAQRHLLLDEARAKRAQAAKDDEAATIALAKSQEARRLSEERQRQDRIMQQEEEKARRQQEEDNEKALQEQIKKDKDAQEKRKLEDAKCRADELTTTSPPQPFGRPKAEVPTPNVIDVPESDPIKKSFVYAKPSKDMQDAINRFNKVTVAAQPGWEGKKIFYVAEATGYEAKYATAKGYAETTSKSRGLTPEEWVREQMAQKNEPFTSVNDYYRGVVNEELAKEKEAKEEQAKKVLEALKQDAKNAKSDVSNVKGLRDSEKRETGLKHLESVWANRIANLPGEGPWGNPETEPRLEPDGGLEL
ncbi:hypothetical protein B7494_g7619 [Chlorociboria aeruginascens]|nr:hypothetical protein B7494_g7619 [Chlorociboria aeruginascens]